MASIAWPTFIVAPGPLLSRSLHPSDLGSAIAFLQYPADAPVPEPVRGTPVVALRVCHPGPTDQAIRVLSRMREIAGVVLDTARPMPYREIGTVTMDSPRPLPRIGYSESLRELADPLIATLPEVLTPGAPFVAMELRHTGGGTRPPAGYEGLGYWGSPFLFFGMSVTPNAAVEQAVAELGERLDAVLAPYRTGTNALTFLLAQHTPEDSAERVRRVYRPDHYARLASIKARYDPANLLGADRNIPPSS
jgi:Berberine and berberine like